MRGRDPQYRFLAACFSAQFGEALKLQQTTAWNWEALVDVAFSEFVLAAVDTTLRRLSPVRDIPAEVSNLFQTVAFLNADRNSDILSEVKRFTAELNAAGIEPVALKGLAHLLIGLYPDHAFRFLLDVDLLVPDSDLVRTAEILQDLGYRSQRPHPIELAVAHCYAPLFREGSVLIDLHRTMGRQVCKTLLPAEEVLRDSVPIEFEGVRLRIPSPQHLMIHHLIHTQLHDSYRDRLWPPLRSMYDLVLLQDRFEDQIDWASIHARLSSENQDGALLMYLLRAEAVLGFKPPLTAAPSLLTRLRWARRNALWAAPALRFLDPLWFLNAGVTARGHRLLSIVRLPGGSRYLFEKFSLRTSWARLKTDVS